MRFIGSKQLFLTATRVLTPTAVFLQMEGAGNEEIKIDGGDLSRAFLPIASKNGATEKALKPRD